MTAPDDSDLEDRLAELEVEYGVVGPDTPAEWVEQTIEASAREGTLGFTNTVVDESGEVVEAPDRSDQVCILGDPDASGASFYVPEEAVPDWIDVEEDLPV